MTLRVYGGKLMFFADISATGDITRVDTVIESAELVVNDERPYTYTFTYLINALDATTLLPHSKYDIT